MLLVLPRVPPLDLLTGMFNLLSLLYRGVPSCQYGFLASVKL